MNQPDHRPPMHNSQGSNYSNPPGFQRQPHPPPQEKQESTLEDLIKGFMTSTEKRFNEQETRSQNLEATVKNLETQIG